MWRASPWPGSEPWAVFCYEKLVAQQRANPPDLGELCLHFCPENVRGCAGAPCLEHGVIPTGRPDLVSAQRQAVHAALIQ